MDALYKIYAKIRLEQLAKFSQNSEQSEDETLSTSLSDYKIIRIQNDGENIENSTFSKRILNPLDINGAVGLASFLFNQLDLVTALGIVSNLEKRAQYDPRFRTSFPDFLRRNSWFL